MTYKNHNHINNIATQYIQPGGPNLNLWSVAFTTTMYSLYNVQRSFFLCK